MVRAKNRRSLAPASAKKVVPRRSTRNKRIVRKTEYQYDSESEIIKNYKLNEEKALKKKKDGCDDVNKKVIKDGDQLRLYFSTATYEVFKNTIHMLYTSGSDFVREHKLLVQHVASKDCSNVTVVEERIRVVKPNSKGEPSSTLRYTINLYHTKSSVLVNGREAVSVFVMKLLPIIEKEISTS